MEQKAKLSTVLTAAIPAPTPRHAQSLSADQLDEHRRAIAFDVEVILDGYWEKHPPVHVKAGILADWADTLEDWTQEQVLYVLRKWRSINPNKRPNPGHILAMLKETRGKAELKRRPETKDETPYRQTITDEDKAHRKAVAEAALDGTGYGFPKTGAGS